MKLSTPFSPNRRRLPGLAATALLLAALALGGCKKSTEETEPQAAIKLGSNATLGKFLTDGAGNTLYYHAPDVTGANLCTSPGCIAAWPLFYAPTITVGAGLNGADFTTGKTSTGENQTFYKGWPLYYFATTANGVGTREVAGEVKGEGLGGVWYVVRPDYTVMIAKNNVVNQNTKQTVIMPYLVDVQGRTLYTYAKDVASPTTRATNCTGGCIAAWPVFYQEKIVVPSGLKDSDFGTITRADGPNNAPRFQTTYKGLPLYYYTPDGDIRGKVEGYYPGSANPWLVAW